MEVRPTPLAGCLELRPRVFGDERGRFVKTFHAGQFRDLGLETGFREQYYSVSGRGVLRGMHFQTPPDDHAKLVTCLDGEVMDAVVDLRRGSPTYGQAYALTLSGAEATLLYVPAGLAHGFFTLSDSATLLYNVTSVHSPAHDAGVRWDSVGVAWPGAQPILSARDAAFPRLEEFDSPFEYRPYVEGAPHG